MALYAVVSLGLICLGQSWLDLSRWFVAGTAYATYGQDRGNLVRILFYFGITIFAVFPPAFLLGMSFPITQKAIQDDPALVGQRVGLIQFFNILGNTIGAVGTGLVLLHWLGTPGTLRLIGLAGLLFVVVLVSERPQKLASRTQVALVAVLVVTVGLFPDYTEFWSRLHGTSLRDGALVAEDRTGVAVLAPGRNLSGRPTRFLYIGGYSQSEVPFEMGHGVLGSIGPLVHPDPRSILVIGNGTGGTPYASGVNPLTKHIRVVEIVEPVFSVMRQFVRKADARVVDELFRDPRFERVVADARHVLFTESQRYDVIEADAIFPHASHAGMLYSVEFFRQERNQLREGGICVQWAATDRTVASFVSVFPYVVRLGFVLLGSNQPIPLSAETLAERLRGEAGAYLAAANWDPQNFLDFLTQTPAKVWTPSDQRQDQDVNTDLFPKDEYLLNQRSITLF
jgi:spermidine synthase